MSVKSPFPGMDPWLERSWGDVHQRLIIYASDVLNEHLPAGLIARTEERVFVESPADQVRHTVPDVRVVETPAPRVARAWNAGSSSAVVFAEPEILEFDGVQLTESYIEIRDFSSGGKVVTTIEVVSPSNKAAGPGRKKYLRKQRESVDAECNLVEID